MQIECSAGRDLEKSFTSLVDFLVGDLRIPPPAEDESGTPLWDSPCPDPEAPMAAKPPLDPKEMGFYVSVAQVGLEMVVPVVVGVLLDAYFEWEPWGVAVGAVLGLMTGLLHLVALTSRHQDNSSTRTKRNSS
jgi:hypothetical protein